MLIKIRLLGSTGLTVPTLDTPLLAQTAPAGPFRTEVEAVRHQAAFMVAAKQAGYTLRPAFFYRNRLDVTKTKALRRVGVDMLAMDRSFLIDGPPDFPTAPLYSDLAVHGTVIRATGDSSRAVFYHSSFTVRVSEVWQGQSFADTVVVRLRSGPVGTMQLYSAMDPELAQGQEVVLFLSPIDSAGVVEDEKQGLFYQKKNTAPGDFALVKAIGVKNGRVFGGKVPLARARKYSQRIAAILDKAHFYQKVF